jgi:predicted HicB family RNase H-like nuclease
MDMIDKYEFHIHYSEEDEAFIGTVAEFPYLSADGVTPEQAYAEIRSVVEEAVDILAEEGKEAPLPFSEREFKGNISLRLSSETHRMATIRSRQEGCSLNQFLTSLIERNLYADSIDTAVKRLSVAMLTISSQAHVESLQQPAQVATIWAKSSQPRYPNYIVANAASQPMTQTDVVSVSSSIGEGICK